MIQTVKTSFLPAGKRDPRQTDGFIMPSECLRRARAFTLFVSANNDCIAYQWWDLYKHWQTHDIVITRFSHEEMKTQWEHPKTGKKKRCAGGLRIDLWTITDHLTVIAVLKYLNAINTLWWSVQSFQKRVLICNEDKSMIKSLMYCIFQLCHMDGSKRPMIKARSSMLSEFNQSYYILEFPLRQLCLTAFRLINNKLIGNTFHQGFIR